MSGRVRMIQPPATQNLFVGISIFFALVWAIGVLWRCGAVLQLRRALGTRRLVAIRGLGRRVRIFRLLERNYLQRSLARNHLQALVHTRQAYPPKTMPCSLLPANPNLSGMRTFLHADDGFNRNGGGTGSLLGFAVEVECRVDCTVELLWDVDLSFLGGEMHVDRKLSLLPTSSSGGQRNSAGGRRRRSRTFEGDEGTDSRPRGGITSLTHAIRPPFVWVANSAWMVVGGRGTSVSGGSGDSIAGDDVTSAGNTFGLETETDDEETGSGERDTIGRGFDGIHNTNFTNGDLSSDGPNGTGGRSGVGRERRMAWNASGLGRLKSAVLAGGSADGGRGWVSGIGNGENERDGGISGRSTNGAYGANGTDVGSNRGDFGRDCAGCGKRSAPRLLAAGSRSKFRTLPEECYFRVKATEPQLNMQGEANMPGGGVEGIPLTGGGDEAGVLVGENSLGEDTTRTSMPSATSGSARRAWPNVGDSMAVGKCSLAVIIRAAGEERKLNGDAAWRRHRPTHVVTRQVLLVQLKERSGPQGTQRAPEARILRHLVAISRGLQGDQETVYSFAEVYGAGNEGEGGDSHTGQPDSPVSSSTGVNQASSSITGASGEDLPEECVICLTDPKDTLLLPCRHLCVCSECFRHVDKCPVCRSAFDNYIVLQGASDPAVSAPAPSLYLAPATVPTRAAPPSTEAVVNAPAAGRNIPGFRTMGGAIQGGSRVGGTISEVESSSENTLVQTVVSVPSTAGEETV